jgi:hypothetical protein
VSYTTLGVRSCPFAVNAINNAPPKESSSVDFASYMSVAGWLSGYLNAYNSLTPNTDNILGNSDFAGALQWVKIYCEKNPLKTTDDAAAALIIELYPHRITKAP